MVILSRIYKLHLPILFPYNRSVSFSKIFKKKPVWWKNEFLDIPQRFPYKFVANSSRENISRENVATLFVVSVRWHSFVQTTRIEYSLGSRWSVFQWTPNYAFYADCISMHEHVIMSSNLDKLTYVVLAWRRRMNSLASLTLLQV